MHSFRSLMTIGAAAFVLGTGAAVSHTAGGLPSSEEYLVLGDTNRGAGEPMVAVNPKDSNNIIVVGMATWHQIKGELPPEPGAPRPTTGGGRGAGLMMGLRTPNSTIMSMAVTYDGGRTWEHSEDPIRQGSHSRCADPVAAAGPDGALYVACINREPQPEFLATDALSVSKDRGKTWSAPTWLIGNDKPYRPYAPGLNPIHSETISSPFDRPWIVIDQSTNTVYAVAAHGSTGEPPRPQSYVMASRDDGKTWSLIYSFDSPEYPQSGGGDAAAAKGMLGVAYVASKSPGGETCPCVLFGLSTNEGKSFEYHAVKGVQGSEGPGGAKLAADPSRSGHFAIMSQSAEHRSLLVTETEDGGKTWSATANAGEISGAIIAKPWMDFSPKGDLAVMWRSTNPDRSYDVYSTLSRDGGLRFSLPLRISHATSPAPSRERGNFLFGDDISDLVVDAGSVHMVWADSRSGFLGTWYGRVPLSAYH